MLNLQLTQAMSRTPRRPIPPVSRWRAQLIRATIFPSPDASITAESWWDDAVGGEPESRTVRPATRQRQEEGPFEDGGRLTLSINALGIVQWTLTPEQPKDLPVDIPVVGPVEELSKPFLGLLNRWFRSTTYPPATRLAFGVTALLPVEGHRDGYETIASYLPAVTIDPENSSDFQYRINRPRLSATQKPGLYINRLSTWSVYKVTLVASAASAPTAPSLVDERFACAVELDINTVPTFTGTFASSDASAVISELERLAVEILAKGDVP